MKPRFFVAASAKGITEIGKRRKGTTGRARKGLEEALAKRWEGAAEAELRRYFSGKLRSFSTPCDLGEMPSFSRRVLEIAAKIPYGEVRSYRWIAERMGRPKATRAVGNALAKNPIPILIPCHRVIRSDGSLGGYALGLGWKRRLLSLERGPEK